MKEATREQKLDRKFRSLEHSLEELKGREHQFKRFMRMIMREKGLKVPKDNQKDRHHANGSPTLEPNLSYTSILKQHQLSPSPSMLKNRKDSLMKLPSSLNSPVWKEQAKDATFAINLAS